MQVEYPSIALHATSRGDSSPYVYCHIDEPPAADAPAPAPDADDTLVMRVLLLTPQDPASRESRFDTYICMVTSLTLFVIISTVEPIFEALSYCASLHPDPQESDDGDDYDDDNAYIDADTTAFEVFTGEEGEELSEVGRVRNAPINDNRYQPY